MTTDKLNLQLLDNALQLMEQSLEPVEKMKRLDDLMKKHKPDEALIDTVGDLLLRLRTLLNRDGKIAGSELYKRHSNKDNNDNN
jgi:hypothetical protein